MLYVVVLPDEKIKQRITLRFKYFKFLVEIEKSTTDGLCSLTDMYDDTFTSRSRVSELQKRLIEGRNGVEDEQRVGRY